MTGIGAKAYLEQQGRVSLRALRREFALDEDATLPGAFEPHHRAGEQGFSSLSSRPSLRLGAFAFARVLVFRFGF